MPAGTWREMKTWVAWLRTLLGGKSQPFAKGSDELVLLEEGVELLRGIRTLLEEKGNGEETDARPHCHQRAVDEITAIACAKLTRMGKATVGRRWVTFFGQTGKSSLRNIMAQVQDPLGRRQRLKFTKVPLLELRRRFSGNVTKTCEQEKFACYIIAKVEVLERLYLQLLLFIPVTFL